MASDLSREERDALRRANATRGLTDNDIHRLFDALDVSERRVVAAETALSIASRTPDAFELTAQRELFRLRAERAEAQLAALRSRYDEAVEGWRRSLQAFGLVAKGGPRAACIAEFRAFLAKDTATQGRCVGCGDSGWVLDCHPERSPRSLELLPCLMPECSASGTPIVSLDVHRAGLDRSARTDEFVMSVYRTATQGAGE